MIVAFLYCNVASGVMHVCMLCPLCYILDVSACVGWMKRHGCQPASRKGMMDGRNVSGEAWEVCSLLHIILAVVKSRKTSAWKDGRIKKLENLYRRVLPWLPRRCLSLMSSRVVFQEPVQDYHSSWTSTIVCLSR